MPLLNHALVCLNFQNSKEEKHRQATASFCLFLKPLTIEEETQCEDQGGKKVKMSCDFPQETNVPHRNSKSK